MLLDAILYSLGAIRSIRAGVKASNAYWDRRLLLNLLLANMGLYFTALFTFIGAFLVGNMPREQRNWCSCLVLWSVSIVA